jgi:hypothetical protein
VAGKGLEGEPSYPSESGEALAIRPVGAVSAALDAVVTWLAPYRQSRVVKVPDFRGQHVSGVFLPALHAGVKLEFVRLVEHPPPVDGTVVRQDPSPGTRVKRDSKVVLIVRHPENPS